MSHMTDIRLVLVFCIFLAISGCDRSGDKGGTPEKERVAAVRVVPVGKRDIEAAIPATGTLVPQRISRLGPRVEGKIEKLYADVGDFVKKGAPLIKLEQETFLIARESAQASLATATANLTKAEVNRENLKREYERQSHLHQQKITSDQQFDEITANYKTAGADVRLAQARIEEATADLRMAEQNLKESVIYAPYAGFVAEKHMEEGEVSNAITFQGNVLVLVDLERVKIECPIAENETRFLTVGKKVDIQLDAFPGTDLPGEITAINPQFDEKSRTVTIMIEMPNRDFKLKGGMFARVTIPKAKKSSVLCIPRAALMTKGGKSLVYILQNGLAKAQTLQLGISDGKLIEVTEGLQEGDLVVVEGFYALKDGAKAEVAR